MPRSTIEILEGRTLEQKKKLVYGVCEAIEDYLYQPDIWQKGSFLRVIEINPANLSTGGEMLSEVIARGGQFAGKPEPRLTVQFVEDRIKSMEQKRAFIGRLTDVLVDTLGCPRENVLIFLLPQPKTNFASGGEMRCDTDSKVSK